MCPGSAQRQRTGTGIHIGRCRWDGYYSLSSRNGGSSTVCTSAERYNTPMMLPFLLFLLLVSMHSNMVTKRWRVRTEQQRGTGRAEQRKRERERETSWTLWERKKASDTDSHCDNNFLNYLVLNNEGKKLI